MKKLINENQNANEINENNLEFLHQEVSNYLSDNDLNDENSKGKSINKINFYSCESNEENLQNFQIKNLLKTN